VDVSVVLVLGIPKLTGFDVYPVFIPMLDIHNTSRNTTLAFRTLGHLVNMSSLRNDTIQPLDSGFTPSPL
jgi:hypothetical protein